MTFCYTSGSSDPFTGLRIWNLLFLLWLSRWQNNQFFYVFCLITYFRYINISYKTVEIKFFLNFLLVDGRILKNEF
jgi:hypothetical protein